MSFRKEADHFGLKIGVEGEQEFKKALREINLDFKVLGSERLGEIWKQCKYL